MFNRKTNRRIEALEKQFARAYEGQRDDYWKLRHELAALKEHLDVEYVTEPAKSHMRSRK